MYFFKSPLLVRSFTPSIVWSIKTTKKKLFLTFDDGPDPQTTPQILSILKAFGISATFFCVGRNVAKFNDIYSEILKNGHTTGNHSFDHVDLWKTSRENYFKNVNEAAKLISTSLFRPPFGHLTPLAINQLKEHYKIVMWSLMSYDFYPGISSPKIIETFKKKSTPGSIWLFHDNIKAHATIPKTLPVLIEHFMQKGYVFESIIENKLKG